MSRPAMSVVIPSWNGRAILEEHLPSVLEAAAGLAEVIVSDDASSDDTAESIPLRFSPVRVVRRQRNGGFAPTANDGVAAAGGDVVILLNNDISVPAGTFDLLAAALLAEPGVFAAVPAIIRRGTGDDESLTRIRFRSGVVSTMTGGDPDADPAFACGGAMAFRRSEFLALGGFDPLFAPFYWEDVDLSYRARKRGLRIVRAAGARVDHDHSRTIGERIDRKRVLRIYERNRLLFTWKNITDPGLWRTHVSLLPLKLTWDLAAHPAFVRGFRDAWALRTWIASARRREQTEATVGDRALLTRG